MKVTGPVKRGLAEKYFEQAREERVAITIIYDNNPYDNRLKAAWGFSCVVKLSQKTIMFDAGGDGAILIHNMIKSGISPAEINSVLLSHAHADHAGGLGEFLKQKNNIAVYVPTSFSPRFKNDIRLFGAIVEEIKGAKELFPGVYTTGELAGGIKEQALVLKTSRGTAVITGCAHPGIVKVVQKAREITDNKICLVLGGFHLGGSTTAEIKAIIEDFERLGVEQLAPCHCTGSRARSLFGKSQNYINCGVGKQIIIP